MGTPFEPIAERMMQAARLKNLSALARFLDVTPQALSNYKKRGEFPPGLIIEFAQKQGLSIDGLLNGDRVEPALKLHCPNIINVEVSLEEAGYIDKLLKILRGSFGQIYRASLDAIVEEEDKAAAMERAVLARTEAPHA